MATKKISIGSLIILCGLLLHGCVVPTDSPEKELSLVHESVPDTISPWDSVAVVFSLPLQDSLAHFTITPSFYMYSQQMCDSRDTVIIRCVEPLDGDTRYVIRLGEMITATNGAVFKPGDDSLVIITASSEREPNNDLRNADSLKNYRFGSVATVNDTDCFLITADEAEMVFLTSFKTRSTCIIVDGEGTETSERSFMQSDTVPVPDNFSPPLYVKVFGYHRSAGGSYKLGILSSDD